jgi:hypothetical protein
MQIAWGVGAFFGEVNFQPFHAVFAAKGDIARRFFGRFGGCRWFPAVRCERVSHNLSSKWF